MMKELSQPYEIMKEEIEMLQKEKEILIQNNLGYAKMIIEKTEGLWNDSCFGLYFQVVYFGLDIYLF